MYVRICRLENIMSCGASESFQVEILFESNSWCEIVIFFCKSKWESIF